jgi:two-component system, OmpR family, response regulator RegX3
MEDQLHIALVEDDIDQSDVVKLWLETAHHQVDTYETGRAFMEAVAKKSYDLLLVDWVLPDYDGGQVIAWIRETVGWATPIIVTTVRDTEADIVAGLRAGADDYLVKPLKSLELIARIETVGRRVKARRLPVVHAGAYEIDTERRSIRIEGKPVELTQKELDLAYYLFSNPGKLFSRNHLLDKIWGINAVIDTRTVDTHVSRLRRKLKLNAELGWHLQPVYGYGYRLDCKESVLEAEK